jgi:hypothetical protein
MNRVLAYAFAVAIVAFPLGGCLTVSWQDDTAATSAVASATPAAPSAESCSYSSGWDSTGAARDIYGAPKEYQCENSAH